MGLDSICDLIRTLEDNPFIAAACGIDFPDDIPSQPTFSRFGTKLSRRPFSLMVKDITRNLTRRMYDRFPGFGKSVAIDSTDVKAWSNGGKLRKGRHSDPQAGWVVKRATDGNRKYVYGYKVHLLADAEYEVPISMTVTAGNIPDIKQASAVLRQARFTTSKFYPDYVICDAGYSSDALRSLIKRQYRAEAIIDPNAAHKKAFARTEKTPEWKALLRRRSSIERLNGRLKEFRRLNTVRVRGRFKVTLHAMLSVAVCQAKALATESRISVRKAA